MTSPMAKCGGRTAPDIRRAGGKGRVTHHPWGSACPGTELSLPLVPAASLRAEEIPQIAPTTCVLGGGRH